MRAMHLSRASQISFDQTASYRRSPLRKGLLSAAFLAAAVSLSGAAPAPVVKVTRGDNRVAVSVEGKPFTEFVYAPDGPRTYFYPVLAPDGTRLTRDFPMVNTPGEEQDHPHHRSLWFAHGSISGVDFWLEKPTSGKVVLVGLDETSSGKVGVIRARHRWEAPGGKLIATDELTVRIQAVPNGRLLDYEITMHALKDEPLVFGDTKEGTMAVRLPLWMTMTHKFKGKEVVGQGHVVNSAGDRDVAAWGKRAAWADYFAPRDGKVYGIAIFDHPANPSHPTWWHARDYGLFAANPFGRHDFEGLKGQPHIGDLTVPAGKSVTFKYRIYIHEGDTTDAHVAEYYRSYAEGAK